MYRLVNVSKSYGNHNNFLIVLDNINLTLPEKGFVSILGKSGSGKSTLLNLLIGLDKPSKGEIFYKGQNINKLKNKKKKYYQCNEIGILFQHFNLFDEMTSLENVILPSLISGMKESEAKTKANLYFNKYGLKYLINQKYKTLSGGEKQRVALIRALINNPKVIIADEPTGALDSKNSILIINDLKELSKDHLVIVVTHNEELIKEVEDFRITIIDGKASLGEEFKSNAKLLNDKKRCNKKITSLFVRAHIKEHKARNILASAAITFSSMCFLLSFGYITGSKESISNYKKESLLYQKSTIAKKTLVKVPDSPIVISKLTRPKISDIDFLFDEIRSIRIENNYQIVFPSYPKFYFNNASISDIEFSSIYNFDSYENILIEGEFPSKNDFATVVVNEEFINKFNFKKEEIINRKIKLSFNKEIIVKDVSGKAIKDNIEFNNELKIIGVVKEFSFLNSPRIYYSYLGIKNYLKSYVLKNISSALGKYISINDAISQSDGNDPNSGYSYNLFIEDIEEVVKIFDIKKKLEASNEYDIESISYDISNSYSSLVDVISSSLTVSVILILFASFFIIAITSYASFVQKRKESAILSILGMNKANLFSIYNNENLLITSISICVSFILVWPAQQAINCMISNLFHLNNIIKINLVSFPIILFILLIFLISIFSSLIPFLSYENGHIVNELKDE